MPKFYVKWSLNPLMTPKDAEERIKGQLAMLEMVKADMKAGIHKDWGGAAGGACGYAISEAASATELFANLLKWMPYVQFEVTPVLTVDQTIGAIKKVAAEMKK